MNYCYQTQCYPYVLQRQRVCPFFKKRSECDSSAKVLVGEVQVALVYVIIYIPYPLNISCQERITRHRRRLPVQPLWVCEFPQSYF